MLFYCCCFFFSFFCFCSKFAWHFSIICAAYRTHTHRKRRVCVRLSHYVFTGGLGNGIGVRLGAREWEWGSQSVMHRFPHIFLPPVVHSYICRIFMVIYLSWTKPNRTELNNKRFLGFFFFFVFFARSVVKLALATKSKRYFAATAAHSPSLPRFHLFTATTKPQT